MRAHNSGTISFTSEGAISHRYAVRLLLILALLGSGLGLAQAQEQERKLLDRVLKPDMSLQSDLQKKQFVPGGAVETKQARTKWFFLRKRSPEKEFAGVRNYDAKTFATQQSRFAASRADVSTRSQLQKMSEPYPAPGYGGVKAAGDGTRRVSTSEFANSTRPFLVRGKSQKALSQQDKQLTIDEVRELLNKNK